MRLTGRRDLDTIGYMCRDIEVLYDVLRARFDPAAYHVPHSIPFRSSRCRRLLYPTDQFPVKSSEAQQSYDKITEAIQQCFGLTRVDINVAQKWKEYSKFFTNEDFRQYFSLASTALSTCFTRLTFCPANVALSCLG